MSFSTLKRLAASAVAIAAAAGLGGCVTPSASTTTGLYAKPIGDAPVTANATPYSAGLVCLGDHARATSRPAPRVAVGRIVDYTGKVDAEGGRKITQGASLMAITAFAKAGARLVERFDTSVSELELKYANNKLISADGTAAPDGDFRRIFSGQVPGSEFYLVGGITELNYNIRSVGGEGFFGDTGARDPKGNIGGKLFVMNIGMDLRLVNTQSLEVVDVISYQKQIIGRELRAGVFSFWDDVLIDVGVGERALEPIQLAVRAAIERAVLEMMGNLYGVESQQVCADVLRRGGDPLGEGALTATGSFRPISPAADAAIGDRRASPTAWHAKHDPAIKTAVKLNAEAAADAAKAAAPAPEPKDSMRPVHTTERKLAAQPTPVATSKTAAKAKPAPAKTAASGPVRTTTELRTASAADSQPALRGAVN